MKCELCDQQTIGFIKKAQVYFLGFTRCSHCDARYKKGWAKSWALEFGWLFWLEIILFWVAILVLLYVNTILGFALLFLPIIGLIYTVLDMRMDPVLDTRDPKNKIIERIQKAKKKGDKPIV